MEAVLHVTAVRLALLCALAVRHEKGDSACHKQDEASHHAVCTLCTLIENTICCAAATWALG